MSSINSRIEYLVKTYCNGNNSEFASKIGINEANVRSYLNGTEPKFNVIEKIAKNFDINFDWLIFGEGDVEKPKIQKMQHNKSVSKSVTKRELNQKYKKGNTIADSDKENLSNKKQPLTNPLPYYSNVGIPLIPIDAMAGFGNGDVQVMDYQSSRYVVPEFEELKAEFMIRVKGSSMYPKYNSGDLLACKKLPLSSIFFQWNKVYVLSTEQGALVKRVKKSEKEHYIQLISDNPNYEPFDLPLEEVYAIALVIGVIRME